ncbi:MAG: hypothetical protein GWQ08_09725 [Verrucomicrobiaceae bacterium]|nr:hypothetical protein [Verrucomicrobiaceae bacterium]
MRFDRFTIKMQEALQAAQEMAADKGNSEINSAHLPIRCMRTYPNG